MPMGSSIPDASFITLVGSSAAKNEAAMATCVLQILRQIWKIKTTASTPKTRLTNLRSTISIEPVIAKTTTIRTG